MKNEKFDIQGHRGCRGLLPENTIPGFLKAVQIGVTTLEMDVVITSDNQVLVSHDPFMSPEICVTPEGKSIPGDGMESHNIYKMTAAFAGTYDCGQQGHPRFPDQQKISIGKPLLRDVIDAVQNYIRENNLKEVNYNIETKCTPGGDHIFHPHPETFCDFLLDLITEKKIISQTIIQSFDNRTLNYIHSLKVPVRLSLLVDNVKGLKYNLDQLQFKPDIYSPHFKLVNGHNLHYLHTNGIHVIPWTINDVPTMQNFIALGVDGIITDYPDKLLELVKE